MLRPIHRTAVPMMLASLALASCDGEGERSDDGRRAGCAASVPGKATVLRYRVESGPTSPGSFDETSSALCARLERLSLRGVEVRLEGHELVVRAPRRLEADVMAATMPARLSFHDWDANVTGRSGPDVPFSGETALFDAVQAASRMRPRAEATDVVAGAAISPEQADRLNDRAIGRYYLFGPDRRLAAGPASSAGALATASRRASPGAQLLKVAQGIVVVDMKAVTEEPGDLERYHVLEDDAELSGADITGPKPESDGPTREPILSMDFTEQGRLRFAALTRRLAERGAAALEPAGTNPVDANQRFAIVLDDRVVSLATIDFRENPNGIDGRSGAQISLDSPGQARRLALLLRARPLPARLVPLTASR